MRRALLTYLLVSPISLLGQDTTRHGWPVTPVFSTHPITGVFSEFRNTLTSDHFHNGADVPKPDGSPVYPVYDGIVTAIGTVPQQGNNAYVRVQYTVSGLTKSDAYVHINPNPFLVVSDPVFAYSTVLGNILPGLGHVHFTNGYVGSEMNAIRPEGGFTPYIDNYPPRILSVHFFVDETNIEFQSNRISGSVDIRVHIAETNAADSSGISGSTTNNGTYIAGYKVYSSDTSTVVYEPPSSGVRYRFDRKPNDSYVHRVFADGSDLSTHIYTITNGDGADYINATRIVNPNSWNTGALPVGNYVVMVFAQDTRSLADTEYVAVEVTRQDLVPPAPPLLRSVVQDSVDRFTISWYPNTEADLRGYRLYFTLNGVTWILKESESALPAGRTSISYNVTSGTIFFRLAAVDSAAPANVSSFSDVYGVRINNNLPRTLIVDGFDRTEGSGSYHLPAHPFAMAQGQSIPVNFGFSTCSNEAVIEGHVWLQNFEAVLWVLGDESTNDQTFDTNEQALVKTYLQNGGKLFVSGSEIAWHLDRPSGPTQSDRDFLHEYLKASYVGDDANEYTVNGTGSSIFAGLSFRYGVVAEGSPYDEDYPDYIAPTNGSSTILHYGTVGNPVYAGVAFNGLFPNGTQPGAVVYIGFPFETITTRPNRDSLMQRVYQFFDFPTDVDEGVSQFLPEQFELLQNYPNPFNPNTAIEFRVPSRELVRLKVYDLLGREVVTLVNEVREPGKYRERFDAASLSSGVYVYRLEAGSISLTKKMLLIK